MVQRKSFLRSLLGFGALLLIWRLVTIALGGNGRIQGKNVKEVPFDQVDAYLDSQMKRLSVPGAILSIVEGDKIVHTRSFGRAHPHGGAPSLQTPFFIGSLTKSITAFSVMQLVDSGKIKLDDPVKNYLRWFALADTNQTAQVTVRHLLNQTSGLPESVGEEILANFDQDSLAAKRQIEALSRLFIDHPVGSRCEYSNLNYNILGLIIETVSGEPYGDYIRNHIFKLLEMNHSYITKKEAQKNGLATGHRRWFGFSIPAPDLPIPLGSIASGQLISCAEDLSNYLITQLNGGQYKNMQIVSEKRITEMHAGASEYIKWGISSGRYGMGWFDQKIGKIQIYSHSGNLPDYSSFISLIPERKRAVVLLVNDSTFGMPPVIAEIGAGLTAFLAGECPPPIKLGFIPWVLRALVLIPVFQGINVAVNLQKILLWQTQPAMRPVGKQAWLRHVLAPLIPDGAMVGIVGAIAKNKIFGFIKLFWPDAAGITLASGVCAGVWAAVRTWLTIKLLYPKKNAGN